MGGRGCYVAHLVAEVCCVSRWRVCPGRMRGMSSSDFTPDPQALAADAREKKRIIWGAVLMLVGAFMIVPASVFVSGAVSNALWIASLPLTLAGFVLVTRGYLARRELRSRIRQEW